MRWVNIISLMRIQLMSLCLLLMAGLSFAQHPNKLIREGNKAYEKKEYDKAAELYDKALEKDGKNLSATYNRANVDFQRNQNEKAAEQYRIIADQAKDDQLKASALHNLGNILLNEKKYDESIKAYKNALKLKPDDEDTRYNLAYAQKMIQVQQQQQQQNKDDKNQDNKDKNEQKDQQQDKNQQKNQDEQQSQQEQPQRMNKEDAERILNALQNQEKDLHKKLDKKKAAKAKAEIEKDW
jgi:Ca-activated chloride channel homolog